MVDERARRRHGIRRLPATVLTAVLLVAMAGSAACTAPVGQGPGDAGPDEVADAGTTAGLEPASGEADVAAHAPTRAERVPPLSEAPALRDAAASPEQGTAPSAPLRPADEVTLERVATIEGDIAPKSVVASGTGLFVAQNMMYRHTVTVYDGDHQLVATIPDGVELSDFGFEGPTGLVRGAPVEAAFSPDGRSVYVTNYSMYGPGFERPGTDTCDPDTRIDDSFVYRIDVAELEIDQLIPVGAVPKVVKTTPDGRYVLVTNWCSYDLSIIDADLGTEVRRVPIGPYPRGLAIDPTSRTAYVAVMGTSDIAVVDLTTVGDPEVAVRWIPGVGRGPRTLVMSPDGRHLYATLNHVGEVARIDVEGEQVTRTITTGDAPRSMDISSDGRALYVTNYRSNTVSVVATDDMTVVQQIAVDDRPIGVTYDESTGEVWVACYSGSIVVLRPVAGA